MEKNGRGNKVNILIYLIIFAFIAITLVGCSGGTKSSIPLNNDMQVNEQIPTIIKPNVKILDNYNVQITEREPNSLTLTGEVPTLQRDDVLVSGQGEGLLRKVVSVQRGRGGVIVQTVPASLEDVFEQVSIHASKVLTSDDIIPVEHEGISTTVSAPKNRSELAAINLKIAPKVIFGDKERDNITLSGNIQFSLQWDIIIQRTKDQGLIYYASYITLRGITGFLTKCNISFLHKEFKNEIIRLKSRPFVILVSGIPLVFTPEIVLYGGFKGQLVADLELGILIEGNYKLGAEYINGYWYPISKVSANLNLPDLEIKPFGNLKSEVFLILEFNLRLYESLGAYVRAKSFIEGIYTYQPNPTPSHMIDILGGLSVGVGAGLGIPLLGYKIASFEADSILEIKQHLPPFPITLAGNAEVPISIQ